MGLTLDDAKALVGERVVYRFHGQPGDRNGEPGIVTSVGLTFVFVRYDDDVDRRGPAADAKATPPELLTHVKRCLACDEDKPAERVVAGVCRGCVGEPE